MHIEKYKRTAVGHLLEHYSRDARNYSNKDIDLERTDQNYNLCYREQPEFKYYEQRLSEVKCQNREDVKTLCDWVITLPKQEFNEEQERDFFRAAYDFMEARYGAENVISAWVHKDEAGQPHLHFAFIPVVLDKKKGIYKVSAKEAITKKDLQSIHKQIESYISKELGMNIFMLNGATKGGNKTVAELKEFEDRRRENTALKETNARLEEQIADEQEILKAVQDERERLLNYFAVEAELPPCKKKRNIYGKEVVEIELEVWEKHKDEYEDLLGTVSYAQDEVERLTPFESAYKQIKQYAYNLKEKVELLEYERDKLKEEIYRVKQRFNEIMCQLRDRYPSVSSFIEQFSTRGRAQREQENYLSI